MAADQQQAHLVEDVRVAEPRAVLVADGEQAGEHVTVAHVAAASAPVDLLEDDVVDIALELLDPRKWPVKAVVTDVGDRHLDSEAHRSQLVREGEYRRAQACEPLRVGDPEDRRHDDLERHALHVLARPRRFIDRPLVDDLARLGLDRGFIPIHRVGVERRQQHPALG